MNTELFNEVLWAALIVGIIVNWLVETWHFNIKEVIANIFIVGLAWGITEYVITLKPQSIGWSVVYVLIACVVAFSPVEVFRTLKTGGKDSLIGWFNNWRSKYTKEEKTEITKTITETKPPEQP